ncbi:MAG TPA: lytic transglycosylase domain-containing protein [Clostridiaceae bacterium]|nr:lytic transglycosylase domain-containing protein [Clostridiaceae bacterium]
MILILFVFILVFSGRWYVRKIYPIKYKDYIFKYSEENGIDPYLTISVIFVESKFYPNAISKKGARGLMQIMPKTGEWIAEQIGIEDYQVDDLFDIETNIRLGTWYLAYLMKQFDGDLILVLAAYNGGQGNVREWLQQNQQVSDFDNFPYKETRDYVVKIDCVYKIYKGLYNRFTT